MEKLERGTQIIYVPSHAEGDMEHEDCECGFVVTDKGDSVFCRYFSKLYPPCCNTTSGNELIGDLRTVANSESTPKDMLVVRDTYRQDIVWWWIVKIKANPEIYGYID